MKRRNNRIRKWLIGWTVCAWLLFPVAMQASVDTLSAVELDSLKQVLVVSKEPSLRIPALSRLAMLHMQKPEEISYLVQLYREAQKADSIPAVYGALRHLSRFYYNLYGKRDSILYWGGLIDSIAKARGEYPNELFDVQCYSCQDLLWSKDYEMALNEAMEIYQEASRRKHTYGMVRCSESLGLIYQAIRRDSNAIVAFQEGLDLIDGLEVANKVETQVRVTSYQAECALRLNRLELVDTILTRYEHFIRKQEQLNKVAANRVPVGREYWLLYSFYGDMYVRAGQPEKAKAALEKASLYFGDTEVEQDYAEKVYLSAWARYYRLVGNVPLALQYLDRLLELEQLPEELQLKAEILEEEGRVSEALDLYEKILSILSRRNDETFFRQISQLQALHELHEKETQLRELEINDRRMWQKQSQLVFSLAVALVLLLTLYILFVYYRRTRRLQQELMHEKESLLASEKKLLRAKERAEEASRMKSAFLANMSHEIRTPLNAIVGFSGLLCEPSTSSEEREEYTAIIHNNTELLLNLVNDVLDLSRMESGDMNFRLAPYDLGNCCQRALDSVRHRIPAGVKLTFSPAPQPVVICTDRLRLQQLLTNLLTNAAKFTTEGEINLAYRVLPDAGLVEIAVTDTGCGIPLEKQAHVFKRFEKLDDYKPGAGLGLSICRVIADRLGGKVSIDASYTAGARFIFVHPYETSGEGHSRPRATAG